MESGMTSKIGYMFFVLFFIRLLFSVGQIKNLKISINMCITVVRGLKSPAGNINK